MRGRRFINLLGGNGPKVFISSTTVLDNAAIGTVIGTLSVIGGVGAYTFTLTSNPGALFSITGNQLKVAAALSDGNAPITVKADNGAGSVISQPLAIIVVPPGGTNGPMDFSVAGNVAATAAL